MGKRRQGRELAVQALYALNFNAGKETDSLRFFWEHCESDPSIRGFARELVEGVTANLTLINNKIETASKNWSLARMSKVDINILRLAVFELMFRQDIPKNVTINEAIEVAKKFGTEDSPAFINGILDEVGASVPDKDE